MTMGERIALDIITDIRAGRLAPGDELPTIAETKQRYDCGYHSVREARLLLSRRLMIDATRKRAYVTDYAPYM